MSASTDPYGPPPSGPIPLTRTSGPPQTAEERQRAANSQADFKKFGHMPPLVDDYPNEDPHDGGRRKKNRSSRRKTRKHCSSRRKTRKHRSNKSRRSRK